MLTIYSIINYDESESAYKHYIAYKRHIRYSKKIENFETDISWKIKKKHK